MVVNKQLLYGKYIFDHQKIEYNEIKKWIRHIKNFDNLANLNYYQNLQHCENLQHDQILMDIYDNLQHYENLVGIHDEYDLEKAKEFPLNYKKIIKKIRCNNLNELNLEEFSNLWGVCNEYDFEQVKVITLVLIA